MMGKKKIAPKVAREDYWIPVEGKLREYTKPILDAVRWSEGNEHGIKGLKDEYFVFQNEEGTFHSGRFKVNERSFTRQFKNIMYENRYDVVFLLVGERNRQYVAKLPQSRTGGEWDVARQMSTLKVGPTVLTTQFPVRIQNYKGRLIVEDCLSLAHGWRPLHRIWGSVVRRNWFLDEFAELLRKMHQGNIAYLESFYDHLFVNSTLQKVKLIDFGTGQKSNKNSDRDRDIEIALRFLKTVVTPPEKQERFLKAYSKGFRKVDLRADTVIKKGMEVAYKRS